MASRDPESWMSSPPPVKTRTAGRRRQTHRQPEVSRSLVRDLAFFPMFRIFGGPPRSGPRRLFGRLPLCLGLSILLMASAWEAAAAGGEPPEVGLGQEGSHAGPGEPGPGDASTAPPTKPATSPDPGEPEGGKESPTPVQMRVVERRPKKGLAYRLTMSYDATARNPDRLVVWLHPTGGYYNEEVERLAPVILRNGFALMVMIDKDIRGWTFDDAKKLLAVSLPDAGTIPGIDLRRPVLLGFSAGGQVALELWRTKPDLYGGVVVDAAYPADTVDGKDVVFAAPSNPAIRDVPLLVLVGGKDPLLWVWKEAEKPWKESGVPLTVIVVPGKFHEWLFGEEQVEALDAWLGKLAPLGEPQTTAPPQEEPAPAVHP